MKKIFKKKEFFMYTLLSAYIFLTTFSNTAWYVINEGTKVYALLKLIRYVCYIMFVAIVIGKNVKHRYSIESIIFMMGLLIFSGIAACTGKEKVLLFMVLFLAASYGVKSDKILKCALGVQGGLLFLTIFAAFLGITDNSLLDVERKRYSLGFAWSSLAPILYFFVIMLYIYARKTKITLIECLVLEIINIFIYKYTNTRMSFWVSTILLTVLATCLFSIKFKDALYRLIIRLKKMIVLIPVISSVISCMLPLYTANGGVWEKLNTILSGRLWQCKNAIFTYGFSLFGVHMSVDGFTVANKGATDTSCFIDMGYLHIAIEYGLFVLVMIVSIYTICIWKAYKNNDICMVCIIVVLSLFCINDRFLLHAFNVFIIYAFCDNDVFKEINILKSMSKPIYKIIGMMRDN